jgi:putative addiction module component (TIGR02574 family)
MPATLERIADEALSLPAQSRAFLAEKLLESLDREEDLPASDAWIAEVKKRCQEFEDGLALGIPAEEVFAELDRELA